MGYIRVSTEEQAKEGISLSNQQKKIETYCDLYGHELLDLIVDAGQSAKSVNRPGMKKLIQITSVKKSGVDGILICKLDRLFRSAEEALRYSRKWDKNGIALISVHEKLDTQSAMGRFYFTIMAAVAEMERNVIGERCRDILKYKSDKNEKLGGYVPYGYDVEVRDGVKVLVENTQEQDVLVLVKGLRDEGYSLSAIARDLEDRGIPTKKGKRNWTAMQIKRFLTKFS